MANHKPIRALELHYQMIQFLMIVNRLKKVLSSCSEFYLTQPALHEHFEVIRGIVVTYYIVLPRMTELSYNSHNITVLAWIDH